MVDSAVIRQMEGWMISSISSWLWDVEYRYQRWIERQVQVNLANPSAMLKGMGRRQWAWRIPNPLLCATCTVKSSVKFHSAWLLIFVIIFAQTSGWQNLQSKLIDPYGPAFRAATCLWHDPLLSLPEPRNWSYRIIWMHLQQRWCFSLMEKHHIQLPTSALSKYLLHFSHSL